MYTDIPKVRELSGLDDSTNIPDGIVKGKIVTATSMVNGAICQRYEVPVKYHRENQLTFTGTGSGAGTLTAVINGASYAITISSGLTAGQAADLMRDAMVGSADFITELYNDAVNNSAVVTITSTSDSDNLATASAQVTISDSGGTVAGTTSTAGTKIDKYPPLIDQLTAEIAAMLLLEDNYGVEAEDTGKDSEKRSARVDKILMQLQAKDDSLPDLKIVDEVTGIEITVSGGNDPGFIPNDTTDQDADNPTAAKATINQVF